LREVTKHVLQHKLPDRNVCITIADADSSIHAKYFEHLTLSFATDELRHQKIWQVRPFGSPLKNNFSVLFTNPADTAGTRVELCELVYSPDDC
jgi:hypothetical protein